MTFIFIYAIAIRHSVWYQLKYWVKQAYPTTCFWFFFCIWKLEKCLSDITELFMLFIKSNKLESIVKICSNYCRNCGVQSTVFQLDPRSSFCHICNFFNQNDEHECEGCCSLFSKGWFTRNICICIFLWSLPSRSWQCKHDHLLPKNPFLMWHQRKCRRNV